LPPELAQEIERLLEKAVETLLSKVLIESDAKYETTCSLYRAIFFGTAREIDAKARDAPIQTVRSRLHVTLLMHQYAPDRMYDAMCALTGVLPPRVALCELTMAPNFVSDVVRPLIHILTLEIISSEKEDQRTKKFSVSRRLRCIAHALTSAVWSIVRRTMLLRKSDG
jgi:hypothetical protein